MEPREISTGTVLITGASSGIGLACANTMASKGWNVFAGIRQARDRDLFLETGKPGPIPIQLDVTKAASISAALKRMREEFGVHRLNGLVNNAGLAMVAPFELTSLDRWREIYDVNVFGVVAVTQTCLPLLREAKGRIVNIASSSASAAPPMVSAYGSSKRALEALSESLRREVAASGVRISIVAPDVIATPIWEKAITRLKGLDKSPAQEGRPQNSNIMVALETRLRAQNKSGAPPQKVAEVVERALVASRPLDYYTVN